MCLVMRMTHQNQFSCTNTPWCPTGRDEDDVVMASLGTCLCICSLHRESECLRALYSSEGLWKRRENPLPLRWMHPQNSYYFCLHGTFDQPLVTYTPCLRQVARWGRGRMAFVTRPNHLEERLLDQPQAQALYTPLLGARSRTIPQCMASGV